MYGAYRPADDDQFYWRFARRELAVGNHRVRQAFVTHPLLDPSLAG